MFHFVIKYSIIWLYLVTGSENNLDTKNFYKHLGFNIKSLRKKHGMTQEEFGKQFNLTKSAIVNYETGIRKVPIDVLLQISYSYDISLDSLTSKKPTIADVLESEIGHIELTENEEELIVNFLRSFKRMKEVNESGNSKHT